MWHIYSVQYYPATRKKILPFVTTLVDLQGIMLHEISQTEKINMARCHFYVESGWAKDKLIKNRAEKWLSGAGKWGK